MRGIHYLILHEDLIYDCLYSSQIRSPCLASTPPSSSQQHPTIPVTQEPCPNMPKSTSVDSNSHAHLNGDTPSFDTTVHNAPVTYRRVQAINSDDKLEKPSIARANAAVSSEKPNGEPEQVAKYKDYVGIPPYLPRCRDTDCCALVVSPAAARAVLGPR